MKAPALPESLEAQIVLGVVVLGVGLYLVNKVFGAAGAAASAVASTVGDVADATASSAVNVLTGNNSVTQTARTDAYQGGGVIGTVGAATDQMSGGFLSKSGEWLGGKLYDWTH